MADPERRHGFPFPAPALPVSNAGLELSGTLASYDPTRRERVRGADVPVPRNKQRTADIGRATSRVTDSTPPDAYTLRYRQWATYTDRLGQANPGFTTFIGEATSRLIVGLGDESVRETSITLHRLDGMPAIPGSAIKGLIRRVVASTEFKVHDMSSGQARPLDMKEQAVLTGAVESASYFTFFDAWYVPASARDDRPLRRDVMTPHHQKYNSSRGRDAPTDFDDPVPVPFISAWGSYRFAILGPTAGWTALAKSALLFGLEHWGIGAKTSSGYGRMVEA